MGANPCNGEGIADHHSESLTYRHLGVGPLPKSGRRNRGSNPAAIIVTLNFHTFATSTVVTVDTYDIYIIHRTNTD